MYIYIIYIYIYLFMYLFCMYVCRSLQGLLQGFLYGLYSKKKGPVSSREFSTLRVETLGQPPA